MNRKIETYEDLLLEKSRLEEQVEKQKLLVKEHFTLVQESFAPIGHTVTNVVRFAGKFTSRDKSNPLVNLGLDFGVEVLIKRIVLANTGWLTRIVLPVLIKNYSSHLFTDDKEALWQKIKSLLPKKLFKSKEENHEDLAGV